MPALTGQAEGTITTVTADGACDGEPRYAAAAARQFAPPPDVVAPLRVSAAASATDPAQQSARDRRCE